VFNGTMKTRRYIKWKTNFGGTSARWYTINDITCLIYVIDKSILEMYVYIYVNYFHYIYIYISQGIKEKK
jgi:hypothetical protein